MTGLLVAFSGRPGVGKTTLARRLAREMGATYLRIDAIEQAIRSAGLDAGPAGYLVGYAVAGANLALGRTVVADSVNPLAATRRAWREAAAGSRVVDVEVVCSDVVEHRRRVEARRPDIEGHALPSWADVVGVGYEPWTESHMVIDTARRDPEAVLAALTAAITAQGASLGL